MPPEEMTGSTHILEFMCYANSRFRRDKIPHGNGDDIFFRCFGSATPGLGRGLSSSRLGFGRRGIVCGSRRCFFYTVVIRFAENEVICPCGKGA